MGLGLRVGRLLGLERGFGALQETGCLGQRQGLKAEGRSLCQVQGLAVIMVAWWPVWLCVQILPPQPPSSVTLGKSLPFSLSLILYLKREVITIVPAPYGESFEGQINKLRQGSNKCQLVFLRNSLFLTFKASSSSGASLVY